MKIKIIIADDNSFIREGLKIILNTYEEFEVLDTLNDGKEAVDYCKNNEVDVALLDVRMPHMNGVEATKIISEETKTKPMILTTFDDDEYILDAIKNGAKGYLLKNNEPERIRDAIRSVYNGNSIIQDIVLEKIKSNLLETKETETKIDPTLFTTRERDIMSLIAKGYSNKEISKQLFISEGTVANYITSILGKTGLEHRTQIAIYFITGKVD
ncbi:MULTISPECIES: response regulator transcription factor [Heyndrickxia]|uniref:DNA-binding response regulator n=1 Tax=Heyndrickxia oleronia TaxID=38875 RepID=A0A8E2ID03_9BACI|nr:response regulator transcription factor [Heyndrickxia oleronia]NYV66128.1 response regulator transcription factor [Bacillus sp. Gen3]OJH20079.1 DNA-binding response regulator [Bacillus obstructivus]MCI1591811.1 response regulator transcription factor [Heyndrickxia oleronia]MCI1615068.1 response regulator transcription factor [Heyndrickxia oleronia]MCI1745935.1 response regulator transcription factor [Heyndrickxia oleronia]